MKIKNTKSAPVCPHCDKELDTIERVLKGLLEHTVIFICPFCKKILGIGYNVGW